MTRFVGNFLVFVLFLALFAPFAYSNGVHKDDIRYQALVNRLTPTFETVVRGLTLGKNEYDQLSVIAQGKTGAAPNALCQQLFADELQQDPNYCNSGQPGATKTDDLQNAGSCLNSLYRHATNEVVSQSDCFAELYKFIEAD